MKVIKVNAFEFKELNQNAKHEVIHWLDQDPIDYETEDEQGNIIQELEYYSDMEEEDIQEQIKDDLKFIKEAKQAIMEGDEVVYSSWW